MFKTAYLMICHSEKFSLKVGREKDNYSDKKYQLSSMKPLFKSIVKVARYTPYRMKEIF